MTYVLLKQGFGGMKMVPFQAIIVQGSSKLVTKKMAARGYVKVQSLEPVYYKNISGTYIWASAGYVDWIPKEEVFSRYKLK